MKYQELNRKNTEVCNSIASRKLKHAFGLLEELISSNNLGIHYDEFRNLEETYQYMLKYTMEGAPDPERKKVYNKLIASSFELSDRIFETLRRSLSPSIEYELKRTKPDIVIGNIGEYLSNLEEIFLAESDAKSAEEIDISPELQKQIQRLFHHIWLTDKLTPDDAKRIRNFLLSPAVLPAHRSLTTTSIALSLQRYFCIEKVNLLFDALNADSPEVSQRAMVSLLINLHKYDLRIPFYQNITNRLKVLSESQQFRHTLEVTITQFIRSKGTEKLQKKFRDEILPEMIKISPHLKNKINLESLMEEGTAEDKNPDWEEIFKDSPGFMSKMEELTEMQMRGDDVFMGSFAMLKSFPFYNEISNWFIPFFTQNPDLAHSTDDTDPTPSNLMKVISRAPILCNSDKYSFCYSLKNLPKENQELLTHGVQAEMEQFKELKDDENLVEPERKNEFISNQYIQDLYRFYKLHPRKADFDDIFSWPFDFHNKQAFSDILEQNPEMLRNIGEYYFAKDYYTEAAEIFHRLLQKNEDGELYQKWAFCHQIVGNYSTALSGYLKAELYGNNPLWNAKKIALCYRNLKQPDKALDYYRAAEKLDPDSLSNQLNIGQCLLELNQFEEALKCYFKVEYLAPGNRKVWRPLAWCSFLTGKMEQAEKYLRKLIEENPSKHDQMNMGHIQWCMDNRKDALSSYQSAISKDGFSVDEFLEIFDEDQPHLLNQGVEPDDVPIMLDQLRYSLEG